MRASSIHSVFVRAGLVAVALSLLIRVPALAQTQSPPPTQQQLPDSVQELLTEFQEKRTRLQQIQQRALEESEALQEEQAGIQQKVETAMAEIDPGFRQRVERLGELQTEAQAAQAEQDQEAVSALVAEGQQIQASLAQTRDSALQREDIQSDLSDFQAHLLEEMVRIEPEAETLIVRLEELAERLSG